MVLPFNFVEPFGSITFTNSSVPRACLIFISLLAWLILVPPFILQLRFKNLPIAILILSSMISCITLFINSILWPATDTSNWWDGEGLCDVEVLLTTSTSLAVAGGTVCLFRQLNELLEPDYATTIPTPNDKTLTKVFERTLCIGLPLLRSGLYYIVSPNRYWITGLHGCTTIIDNSWPSIPLYSIWPLAYLFICAFYVIKLLYRVYRYNATMREIVSQSSDRVKRLMVFACLLLCCYVPYAIYLSTGLIPSSSEPFSWSRIHPSDWGTTIYAVQYYESLVILDFCRTAVSFITFACFGFGKDANEMYREIGKGFKVKSRMIWRAVDDGLLHTWRWRK